jgi:hypothetical protein
MTQHNSDISQRFWAKVSVVNDTDSCWLWTAGKDGAGRGAFKIAGVQYIASRVAYWLTHGSIGSGKHILHTCDNPTCVRPDHLYEGTHTNNMQDRIKRGRWVGGAPRKLLAAQEDLLLQQYKSGQATQRDLAQQFNLSEATVSRIVHGRPSVAQYRKLIPGESDPLGIHHD